MSRSDYSEDFDDMRELAMWRGAVRSASLGRRGQAFFKALLAALDALPEKRLITDELEASDGNVCAIGALGKARQIPMADFDPENHERVAKEFDIADALAREVFYMNDEAGSYKDTPEQRFIRIRAWVEGQITRESLALPNTAKPEGEI